MKLVVESNAGASEAFKLIEEKLLDSLAKTNAQGTNCSIVITLRDDANKIVAGITASTSYGWLLIKNLWISDNHRRQGHGRRLMNEIMHRGTELGCHAAWLDTSNPAAVPFYKDLGFQIFAQLENQMGQSPTDHRRWFMKRPLS